MDDISQIGTDGITAGQLERFDVLGVPISAIDPVRAVTTIEEWVRCRARTYVCVTGVHGVLECRDDHSLLAIHREAGMVTPDGMPMVWIARARGLRHVERVYGPDLMLALSARAGINGLRHFYFGGGENTAERLSARLRERCPGLDVVGTFTPPFGEVSAERDAEIVAMINASGADVLWVGLSTPKQERWMRAHRAKLDVPVMIGVGAAFDFLSGIKPQAPRWMQRNGLEWLFRALTEPRRLGRRYVRLVPRFIFLMAASRLTGIARFRMP